MMQTAVAYARVSTTNQADHGVSLREQQAKLELYAQLHEIEIVETIIDAGESAKSMDRPGLKRCLELLDNGDAEALLVVKLDRLTRSVKDLNHLLETYFADGKNSLMSVNENLDTGSATGRLVINIMAVVSQWEREAIGERTRAAMQHMRATGQYTGGRVRYGYSVGEDGRTLVYNDDEQEVIRKVKTLHASEKLSLGGIAKTINLEGYRTRDGGKFQAVQVRAMLKD